MPVSEKVVDDFLAHHGVPGMKKGYPKTNLDRISRMARGTSKLKATMEKARVAQLKKAESDAKKVAEAEKANIVIDKGPTKMLPKVIAVKPDDKEDTKDDNDNDPEDMGESFAQKMLKKCGTTRVGKMGQ